MTASVHPDGIALVKRFEGLRLAPYLCPAGVWTIGYGATRDRNGARVTAGTEPVTAEVADMLLARDAGACVAAAGRLVRVSLASRQIAALTSFAFNLGVGALRASTLLRRVNERDWDDVPRQFQRWTLAGGRQLPGLLHRRQAEIALWCGDGPSRSVPPAAGPP